MTPHQNIAVPGPALDRVSLALPSRDSWADWRRIVARLAAILLHVLLIALFFLRLPTEERPAEPPSIAVELVQLPEPKRQPMPQPKPIVQPQEQPRRESGGDPDRAPGKAPDAPKAEDKPAPPKETATPKPVIEPTPAPAPEAVPKPKSKAKSVATAAPRKPPSAAQSRSNLSGEGGGDRYLNRLRDLIESNLIYPASARSLALAGVAEFEMIVDRQGRLLSVRVLQSSGDRRLDQAGMNAIELSTPFPPLPPDVKGDAVGMVYTMYIGPQD